MKIIHPTKYEYNYKLSVVKLRFIIKNYITFLFYTYLASLFHLAVINGNLMRLKGIPQV